MRTLLAVLIAAPLALAAMNALEPFTRDLGIIAAVCVLSVPLLVAFFAVAAVHATRPRRKASR